MKRRMKRKKTTIGVMPSKKEPPTKEVLFMCGNAPFLHGNGEEFRRKESDARPI